MLLIGVSVDRGARFLLIAVSNRIMPPLCHLVFFLSLFYRLSLCLVDPPRECEPCLEATTTCNAVGPRRYTAV